MPAIQHPHEARSNQARSAISEREPRSLRTYTASQAVLARSAGIFHWTPEGRRLYDFTSGVLVANLGHNPTFWLERLQHYLGWPSAAACDVPVMQGGSAPPAYVKALPLTAYNAITEVEVEATQRLVKLLQNRPGGARLEQVLWAATGSEAVQKALWAALARDTTRSMIVATRYGFHGKKGLAGATTGCELDHERDPRVRFIGFPREECCDVSRRGASFDPLPYRRDLEALHRQFGRRLTALITEPYLGGGGSFHPPASYLRMLQEFCRDHDIIFILDEVQSNFGRTGRMFAYEAYGLEPDVVILGKGLANGAPGAAAVGPAGLFASLDYGEGSDTYSANPLTCAAVLATLDSFEREDVIGHVREISPIIEAGLVRLKQLPFVAHVRGEDHGMVWGVELGDHGGHSAADIANRCVLTCYRGEGDEGIHLLGPLAKKVIRVAPPLTITAEQARQSVELMFRLFSRAGNA